MKNIKIQHVLYIGLLLFLGNSLLGSLRLFLKAQDNLHTAQLLLESESQKNTELHNQLILVGKQIYIERVARDTLGLSHSNEVVFVLPAETEVKKLSPRLLSDNKQFEDLAKISHWKEWLDLFD
jgi:cell division protein FtsB